jgi:hypothetical protein
MKSIINIKFKRINRIKVDKKLLLANPNLIKATDKTIKILCREIEKYFQDHHIEADVSFELEEN